MAEYADKEIDCEVAKINSQKEAEASVMNFLKTDENQDTIASLRARVAELEEELLVSKRAARLMRARK